MFETIFSDIVSSAEAVIRQSGPVMLALVAIVGIGKGLVMRDLGEIFGRTAQGLLILALLVFAYEFAMNGDMRFAKDVMTLLAERSWREFAGLTVLELIGYYIWVAALILVAYVGKTALRR